MAVEKWSDYGVVKVNSIPNVGDVVGGSFEAVILHIYSMECCQTGEMSTV